MHSHEGRCDVSHLPEELVKLRPAVSICAAAHTPYHTEHEKGLNLHGTQTLSTSQHNNWPVAPNCTSCYSQAIGMTLHIGIHTEIE